MIVLKKWRKKMKTKTNLSGDIQERLYNAQVRDNAYGAAGSWAYDIWAAGQAGDD